jgi:small-conductance mechanosensitive channel
VDDLVDVLLHPARWAADASELRPLTRIYLSLAILALTVAAAMIAGALSARWAHRRTKAALSERNERRIERLSREGVALTIFIGAYLAIEVSPLPSKIEAVLAGIAFVLGALVSARIVIRVVALLLTSSLTHVNEHERTRLEREYVPLAEKATSLAVAFVFAIVVAKHFGKDVTSLVAALGVGSLAIGLAAQQTLGNMIAGFTLLVDRPFRPGDRIKLASGETGEVQEIGVRSTRILLGDANLLIVPNTELVNSRVVNYALPTKATRGEVKVVISYGANVERARTLLCELALADERIARAPEPVARVAALTERGVELAVGFEVALHGDAAAVEEALRRAVLARFSAEKIEIAYYRSSQGVPSGSPA